MLRSKREEDWRQGSIARRCKSDEETYKVTSEFRI